MNEHDHTLLINLIDKIEELLDVIDGRELSEVSKNPALVKAIDRKMQEVSQFAEGISPLGKADFEEIEFGVIRDLSRASFTRENLLNNHGLWHQVKGALPKLRKEIAITLSSAPA